MATEQSVMALIRAARPSFRNRFDKVSFAVHSAFVAAGCVLHATGPSAFADDALSSFSAVGIDNWNDAEDNYAFVYSNPKKSSKKVLVKCLVMNDKLLVDVLEEGGSKPLHFEVDVGEYVEGNGGTNYGSQFKNLGKLVTSVNKQLQILDKLDGASASSSSSDLSRPSSSERMSREDRPKLEVDDPENPYISPHPGFVVPPVPSFGGSGLFPGPGMYPSRGDFGGGSMLVGPTDPRFFGGGTGGLGFPGNLPVVPPGARFDPYDLQVYLDLSRIDLSAAAAAMEAKEDDDEDEYGSGTWGQRPPLGRRKRKGAWEEEESTVGDGLRRLEEAIGSLAQIYQNVEEAKQRQMELEKQRMQFAKDLEIQRMKVFLESQVQLEKLKRAKQSSENSSYL